MKSLYDASNHKINLAEENDLTNKVGSFSLTNYDASIGESVYDRLLYVIKQHRPTGVGLVTVNGATFQVIGFNWSSGYGAYIAFYYFDDIIVIIRNNNNNFTYKLIL